MLISLRKHSHLQTIPNLPMCHPETPEQFLKQIMDIRGKIDLRFDETSGEIRFSFTSLPSVIGWRLAGRR
jgi:hypothetical protein